MNLRLNFELSEKYVSGSQISRIITEDWVSKNMFCPICGAPFIKHYKANRPVADFFCESCHSDFELKSKKSETSKIGNKITDGAYEKMIERITSFNNPHLLIMTYAHELVNNLMFIPNYFFVPEIIEKRTPLSSTARRAGWVGCNIIVEKIPQSGKIFIVRDSKFEDKQKILLQYQRTVSLCERKIERRGWIMDVLKCIEKINNDSFSIDDVYFFADELKQKHPNNNFVKDKIRQQLQLLRDKGFIEFKGKGYYKKIVL